MVVAPGGCRVLFGRNRIGRPASPRQGDAAVEFISAQSPDMAVALPPRVLRAEKNLVRTGRAEFTRTRSPSGEPGRAWVFSGGEGLPLGPNKALSRSPTRWDDLARASRREDPAERQRFFLPSWVKLLWSCATVAPCWLPQCGLGEVPPHRVCRPASWRTRSGAGVGPWPRWPWACRSA